MPGAELIPLPTARTLSRRLLKKALEEEARADPGRSAPELVVGRRPQTRSECRGGARPCPFVSCRYHLYLEVNPNNGSVRFNYPGVALKDLEHTCALDVAEAGGLTLEVVGRLLNVTRERARQLEAGGLVKLRRHLQE